MKKPFKYGATLIFAVASALILTWTFYAPSKGWRVFPDAGVLSTRNAPGILSFRWNDIKSDDNIGETTLTAIFKDQKTSEIFLKSPAIDMWSLFLDRQATIAVTSHDTKMLALPSGEPGLGVIPVNGTQSLGPENGYDPYIRGIPFGALLWNFEPSH